MRQQLQAIFLIVLIAISSAAQLQSKIGSPQKILGDIQDKNSQFYQMLEEGSQFVVDQVLSLLLNLEDAAKKDLVNLNLAWVKEKALLESIIEKARVAWRTQQAECNRLEAEQHELEHQIKIRIEETAKNNKEIQLDTIKIVKAKKELCESNSMYIDHIIDHRDALLLFGILKKAIEGYTPGSFVQLSEFKQNAATLGDFINIFAQQHTEEFNGIMSQLRQVRLTGIRHNYVIRTKPYYVQQPLPTLEFKAHKTNNIRIIGGSSFYKKPYVQAPLHTLDFKAPKSLNIQTKPYFFKKGEAKHITIQRAPKSLNIQTKPYFFKKGEAKHFTIQRRIGGRRGAKLNIQRIGRRVNGKFHSRRLSRKVANHSGNKKYRQVNRVVNNLDTKGKEIDNKKQQIKLQGLNQETVRSLAMVKGQLIRIIDNLTLVEKTKQHTQQVQEQQANENAAIFKSHLQDEQRRLTRRNEQLAREIAILRVELKYKIIQVHKCRVQEATLLKAYKLAQKNLVIATERYNARRKTLEGEIVLFTRLYRYYKEKVYGVATQADKQRVQDHVDNGNFKKSASYTAHTTSRFDKLQGNAGKTLHAEAERTA